MVHALTEIHRVLRSSGYVIDLRPFGDQTPIAIVSGEDILPAGYIDVTDGFPDDLAANATMAHVVQAGLFTREKTGTFPLYTYWDTAAQFKTYIDNRCTGFLPPGTLAQIELLLMQQGSQARIRTHLDMMIARYRK